MSDAVLDALVTDARADEDVLGLLLTGSRAGGFHVTDSDYDVHVVLTDEAWERRESKHVKREAHGARLDLAYTSLSRLARAADETGWWTPGFAWAQVIYDATGEITRLHASVAELTDERARALAAECFDGYLNCFVRSVKAWHRGHELAGRIHAAASADWLLRTLFALERRFAPYVDRLGDRLELVAPQGWDVDELRATLLELVRSGDPVLQQRLESRVDRLLRERGYGDVVESWGGDVERAAALQFT